MTEVRKGIGNNAFDHFVARPTKQTWALWRPSSSKRKPLRTLPQAHNSELLFTGDASVVLAGVGPPAKTQESLLLAR